MNPRLARARWGARWRVYFRTWAPEFYSERRSVNRAAGYAKKRAAGWTPAEHANFDLPTYFRPRFDDLFVAPFVVRFAVFFVGVNFFFTDLAARVTADPAD